MSFFPNVLRFVYRVATQGFLLSLELRVQFCLLVCCTYPSSSTVNKEKNLIDQRASLRVDTRETQQQGCLTQIVRDGENRGCLSASVHRSMYVYTDQTALHEAAGRQTDISFSTGLAGGPLINTGTSHVQSRPLSPIPGKTPRYEMHERSPCQRVPDHARVS